ncbi:uncharacterized protein LOC121856033 [Homarus americanus]|uniref:uncharacterized protein LOC121856033 n=1 Tax=Homarus americanus TaxID=6706 RepID=UPI001C4651E4|nr:uncharacterized protein LOC121856033 [Homarus americanus]
MEAEKRKHEEAMEEEKRKALEVQDRVGIARPSNNDSVQDRDQSVFDITKHLRLVPQFDEMTQKNFSSTNDIAGTRVVPDPVVTPTPTMDNNTKLLEDQYPGLFPACVVTRSISLRDGQNNRVDPVPNVGDTPPSGAVCVINDFGIKDLYVSQANSVDDSESYLTEASGASGDNPPKVIGDVFDNSLSSSVDSTLNTDVIPIEQVPINRKRLISDQESDPELLELSNSAVSEEEADDWPLKVEDVTRMLQEYKHLFGDVPWACNLRELQVTLLPETTPIKQAPFKTIPANRNILREEVDDLLQHELIEPSDSDWVSPCVLVPRLDGSFRMCADYRADTYPLPRIDDILDSIGQAKFVTKLDIMNGCYQVKLA